MAKLPINENYLEMQVRDYELDLQGIVNNSVYLNYLEHARHTFLKEKNIDFEGLFKQGIAAILVKAEINYKKSLRSKDIFGVFTKIEAQGRFKMLFHQRIVLKETEQTVLTAIMTTACVDTNSGKPLDWDKSL